MSQRQTFAIVGAGLAGGRAAETLRAQGFDGQVVLIGAEPERPYKRPPLSKEYLRGESSRDELFLRPAAYYEQQQIDLRLGQSVREVRPEEKLLDLENGEQLRYDKLLIAVGASPTRLPVSGADLPGVVYLRWLEDADALAKGLEGAPRVLIVGAGFIGCEIAASARSMGCEVTLVEIARVPLARALGEEVGSLCAEFHRDHGVDLRLGRGIAEFRGTVRVEAAVTTAGEVIPCDLAVVGIGVAPAVGFLKGSGVEIENGILVDELCRTSVADIFAAGDAANWWHPILNERLRVEHYDNAHNQAVAAARSMLGKSQPYAPTLYFWSSQYDLKLEMVGHPGRWDEVVVRGRPADRAFSVFYLWERRIQACFGVNRFKDLSAVRRVMQSGVVVDPGLLANEGADLRQLGPA